MAGVKFIQHQDSRILLIDFTRCELDAIVHIVKETKKLIETEPPASVLTLTDIRGTTPGASILRVIKELAAFDKPYVRAGAIVGADGIRKTAFAFVVKFTGRNFVLFDDIEEAKDWLAGQ